MKQFRIFLFLFPFILFGCRMLSPQHGREVELVMDNLQLTELSDSFCNQVSLRSLSLFNNHLSSLPDSFVKLQNLEVLYLGKNNFTSIPKELFSLKKLRVLSMSFNQIDSIPEAIKKCRIWNY